jgi:hypothetical protein
MSCLALEDFTAMEFDGLVGGEDDIAPNDT